MDIQQVNGVLSRAIMGLQGAELEAMIEATAVGRTSYQVPAPGKVGPRPKKSRPKSGAKWSMGTINMVVRRPIPRAPGEGGLKHDYRDMLDPVRADIRGVWAVHKVGFWQITHAPTGMKIPFGFDNKEEAKRAVDLWVEEIPALLWLGKDVAPGQKDTVNAGIIKHRARMKDLIEKAQQDVRDEQRNKEFHGELSAREKKKLGPPVKAGGNQWKRAAFEISTMTGENRVAPAMIRGVWAVHKGEKGKSAYLRRKGWLISHAPTGLFVFGGFSSQKHAKAAVDEFIFEVPTLISAGKSASDSKAAASQVRPYLNQMEKVARKHGGR